MPHERIPTDTVFGFNAVDNNELDNNLHEMTLNSSQNKRVKSTEKPVIHKDLTWARSLLNPSMEQQFTKFKIVSVISHSNTILICEILPEGASVQPNDRNIIAYFSIWWWQDVLKGLEFSYLNELFSCFPFLQNIYQQNILLKGLNPELILLREPKLVQDQSNPNRTLVTCKRFLLI